MKLIEGIKQKGKPFEIPDCTRSDLPSFFIEMGFKIGAEVGVEKGIFSELLCKAGLKISSIDPWFRDKNYNEATTRLSQYPNCKIIRKTSMDALSDFEKESLDFVYIDANHEFKYVAEDLDGWTKKVKHGGVVAGHDYFFLKNTSGKNKWHVGYVLKAYTEAYNIKNWYVIGKRKDKKRDKWRSWMFVKP